MGKTSEEDIDTKCKGPTELEGTLASALSLQGAPP
jgi:hypothetical protein